MPVSRVAGRHTIFQIMSTIEIQPGTFIHTIWFIDKGSPFDFIHAGSNNGGDVLASLLKIEDKEWELRGRVRIYKDNKSFDSEDIKIPLPTAYLGQDSDTAFLNAQLAIQNLRQGLFKGEMQVVEVKKDGEEYEVICKLLSSIPGFHVMRLQPDENSQESCQPSAADS